MSFPRQPSLQLSTENLILGELNIEGEAPRETQGDENGGGSSMSS